MPYLSSVAEIILGQSPPSSAYNDKGDGLPFYQGKTDFGFNHPKPRLYCISPKKIAEAGDILISVRAPVGPTNIAFEKSCIGRGLAAIRAKNIDPNFLFFNLRYIEPYIASLGTGSTFTAINKHGSSGKCRDKRFQLSEQAGRSDASRMGPVWFVGDATAKSGIEKSSPRQYISCWFPNQSTKGDWPWRRQVICTTLWG